MPDLLERLKSALADRYAVESEIGRGGMAVVFLAEDLKHHRKVAIKVLHPELAVTLAADRFLQEIQIVARLEHPHILTLIDSAQTNDFLYYIMPYVRGESLRDRLEREDQLPVPVAVRIASEVADGLDFAHRQGVIHRDVKPGNILLSDNHAVITDFGIARAITVAQEARVTSTGLGVGTPLYASPEQAAGSTTLDGRTDTYSLGCVLYEMLSGDVPLMAPTPQAILARRMAETPAPLHVRRDAVTPALDQAIAKALSCLPADRWDTAARFAEALQQSLASSAIADGKPAHETTRGAPGKRRTWLWLSLSLPVFVAAYFGVTSAGSRSDVGSTWDVVGGLDEIERLAGELRYRAAYDLAAQLDAAIENDSVRGDMWSKVSMPVTIHTKPPGARVSRRDYTPADAAWEELGTTPVDVERFPIVVSRVRLELEGYRAREIAASMLFFRQAPPFELDEVEAVPAGMTRIAGEAVAVNAPGLVLDPLPLGDFLMDLREVTNREYKAFVDAGGYRDPTCWLHPFARDGRTYSFGDAAQGFTDQTGLPGPSTWRLGSFPEGAAELPVGGVSWYEAEAYACSVGKDLPTIYHWYGEALRNSMADWSPYIVPLSNFSGEGSTPAGRYPGVTMHGVQDMAGNVREWTRNADGENRYILGGGWNDPTYMFRDPATISALDRSPSNGIRLVAYTDTTNLARAGAPIERALRDYSVERPASDAEYASYLSWYAYDHTPLNAVVVSADTAENWIREQIEMDAAYGERLTAYLLLPRDGRRPFQVVVFFPGSWPIYYRSFVGASQTWIYSFVPETGRALLFPVLKGTFERGTDLKSDYPDDSNMYRNHVTSWAQDLGRSIDYLETRSDIDTDRLAYLGFSWGGWMGAIMTAVEPRFKASVLWMAGLLMQPAKPQVDVLNFLPRVTVPTLMVNGRYDGLLPLESSAEPFYELLGTSPQDKRLHALDDAGHSLITSRDEVIRETLAWFDRYLGPVE